MNIFELHWFTPHMFEGVGAGLGGNQAPGIHPMCPTWAIGSQVLLLMAHRHRWMRLDSGPQRRRGCPLPAPPAHSPLSA